MVHLFGEMTNSSALSEKPNFTFNSFLAGLVHVALPKWPLNQFQPVQHARQQVPRAYCSNIYTLSMAMNQSLILFLKAVTTRNNIRHSKHLHSSKNGALFFRQNSHEKKRIWPNLNKTEKSVCCYRFCSK